MLGLVSGSEAEPDSRFSFRPFDKRRQKVPAQARQTPLRKQREFQGSAFAYEDEDLARLFGLFVAKLAVDNWLPDPWYYLRPMDFAWAVDIIRRAAVECKEREIRRPKLYESLDFLEKQLDEKSTWLVRRYRRELRWDRRNNQEKEELREILRVTTRGIQFACVKLIVRRLNELAIHFRENKPSIDNLRLQLVIVRRPCGCED